MHFSGRTAVRWASLFPAELFLELGPRKPALLTCDNRSPQGSLRTPDTCGQGFRSSGRFDYFASGGCKPGSWLPGRRNPVLQKQRSREVGRELYTRHLAQHQVPAPSVGSFCSSLYHLMVQSCAKRWCFAFLSNPPPRGAPEAGPGHGVLSTSKCQLGPEAGRMLRAGLPLG